MNAGKLYIPSKGNKASGLFVLVYSKMISHRNENTLHEKKERTRPIQLIISNENLVYSQQIYFHNFFLGIIFFSNIPFPPYISDTERLLIISKIHLDRHYASRSSSLHPFSAYKVRFRPIIKHFDGGRREKIARDRIKLGSRNDSINSLPDRSTYRAYI